MQDTISVKGLHTALNDKDYICSSLFASNIASAIHAKPVGGAFLYGHAGTGKSLLPQVLSEILERKLYFHQCSAGTREDDLLMRIWPSEETTSGVKIEYGKIFEASKASQSEIVVVVLATLNAVTELKLKLVCKSCRKLDPSADSVTSTIGITLS